MARLDILVHRGCFSESSVRTLAQFIREELPHWEIAIRSPEPHDEPTLGMSISPVFLLDGRIIVTGVPRKDWLLARLRAWEKGV